MDKKKEQLIKIVGREYVFNDTETIEVCAKDQSFVLPMKPWFVAKPKNMDEVQKLVKWANETNTPLVPVSSGPPHFYGDTVPSAPGGVIVELGRMNKILRIDRRNRMVVIEPGVTYSQLEPELAKEGLRVTMPLLPRANKSVISSLLERQPTIIPRYNYSLPEPLRNCGIVWGSGDIVYSGDSGTGPYSLEEQWNRGMRQVDPRGPNAVDFHRLVTGAQGSLGIVVWASVKCEILPSVRKLFFVPADKLEDLMDFSYRLQRLRLGDEVILANNTLLATMLGKNSEQIGELKEKLPLWVMIIGVAGRALLPEEKLDVQVKDLTDLVQHFGLKLQSGIPGASNTEVLNTILSPSTEPYWKLKYKGACEDIFFLTTLDKTPHYIKTMYAKAEALKYPTSDIGIYIQPQHQGVSNHCEFNLPYNPKDAKESARIKELYAKTSEELIGQGAYFARPYGIWANLVYNRDAQGTMALRKIKKIFDPNNIMNPGKLCFKATGK
jgi:FAD/FMN-containing dehydrogenase